MADIGHHHRPVLRPTAPCERAARQCHDGGKPIAPPRQVFCCPSRKCLIGTKPSDQCNDTDVLPRAVRFGVMAALDDSPRPGKEPTITDSARAWVVSLACQKPKELGYPHELWTTRLLARHVRETAETAGHPCLTRLAQGTVCKILDRHDVQPHKVRYYLERRDEAFEQKMAEVLCVYREVAVLRESEPVQPNVAIISYDEKPGIQAISSTAPDLPPQPGFHAGWARDHEYKRHGTLSLLAGIDLLTGKVHACVENCHRSREFSRCSTPLIRRRPPSS
jgi:hypothetical protein